MSRALISKIPVSGIGSYIQSTRNVNNIGNGLVLLPRTGAITLDFSNTNATSCTINFKRESGNGLVFANAGSVSCEYQITSKTVQALTFDLGQDKIIRLNRTVRSRGNIIILDVSLWGEALQSNWNDELRKCKEHACLRLVGTELYASEGAYIKGTGITIQTDPPNVCTTNGEGIKFTASCKILKLNIVEQQKELEPSPPKTTGEVIFDTNVSGFNRIYCNNFASSDSGGIILDHHGSYTIPLSSIKSGQRYAIHVYISRLDGNGKVMFGLTPDTGTSMFVTAGGVSSKDFTLNTVPSIAQQGYSVSVWRHSSATGKVKIDRIIVERTDSVQQEDGSSVLTKNHFTLSNIPSVEPIIPQLRAVNDYPLTESDSNDVVGKYEKISKQFAIFPAPIVNPQALNVVGSVSVRGFKSRQWLYRAQTMLPGIVSNSGSGILICDVDTVAASPRVWIGEFSGDKQAALAPLAQSQVIFTPSLENKLMLSQWFPNADVKLCDLPLPKIQDKQDPDDYYMYMEESKSFTEHLLNIWDGTNLCIIGTRLKVPDGMRYMSDYVEYEKLSESMSKCKGLITLTHNNNFKSGIVDLALSMGVPVLTNNTHYFEKAKVVRHTPSSMITKEMLQNGLRQMSSTNPDPNHNDSVIGSLRTLGII
jgi:hypothetical protein